MEIIAFQDHFLDEATTGALLGFGAGGLMQSASISGSAFSGVGKVLKKVKKDKEFTEENMPFNDTGTILDSLNPNMSNEEMLEVAGENVEEKYDIALEYLRNLSEEDINSIMSNELQNSTLENFQKAVKPEPTDDVVETALGKYDTSGLLDRVVNAKTMNDTKAKEDLEQELIKPNGAKLILEALDGIGKDAEVSTEHKSKLSEVFMDIATNPSSGNDITVKQAEAALNKLGIDFTLEKGSDKSAEDSYGSLYNNNNKPTKEEINTQSREQKFRSIVEKIVGKSTGNGTDLNTRIQEVTDFFMSMNPNAQKDKQFTDLLDFMTIEGYGSAVKEVSEAMDVLSDDNKQSLLDLETRVNHLLLELGATNSTISQGQKKSVFTTRYDMLIGNKNSDMFSIQNYIDNAMKLMQKNVPITVRNTGLRNLATRLDSWIKIQDKKIDNDIRTNKLKDRAREELAMFENTLDLVKGFLDNKSTKGKPKKGKPAKENKNDTKEPKKENKKKVPEKSKEDLLKDSIKKLVVNDSYNDVIDKAKDSKELLEVVKTIVKTDSFTPNTNTYAIVKTLETGVDFISFGYENMDTLKPEVATQPLSSKSIKSRDDLTDLELDKIFVTSDAEYNFNNEIKNDAALKKLNKIVSAVINIFNDKPLSKDELKQNKSLVLLLDDKGKIDSSYLNLSIAATVESIVKTSRSLSVDYADINKEERLNLGIEGVEANELAAAGIPKNTLIDIIAKKIVKGINWKKAEKTVTLNMSDISTRKNKILTVDENAHNIDIAAHILSAKILSQIATDSVLAEHTVGKVKFMRLPVTYMWENSIPVTDIKESAAFDTIGEHLDGINEKLGFTDNEEVVGIIADPKSFGNMAKLVKRSKQAVSKKAKKTIQNMRNTAFRIANQNSAVLKASPEKLFEMYGVELGTIPPAVLEYFNIDTSVMGIYKGLKADEHYDAYNKYMVHRYLTKENAGSVIGKVMQTVQVVKTVQELKTHLLRKDGSLKPDAKIYYDAFIGSNARVYLRTEGFSTIQEDKLLRHLFVIDNPTHKPKTIKKGSFDELLLIQDLMVGLSEVKGLTSPNYKSEDKATPENTYIEFHKVLARFRANKTLKGLVSRIKNNKLHKEDSALIAELVGGIKNYVAINALIGLHTYNLSADNTTIEVTSESDGKNSAVAFALMSNSSNTPHLRIMLLSVGVVTVEGLEAYSETLSAKEKEALDILTANGYLPSQEELNTIHPIQDAYQAAATKFIASIPEEGRALIAELIGEELIDSDGNVTSAGRNFAKDPTMTFHYGRQAKAMAGGVGTNTTTTFLEDVLSSEDFSDEEKLNKFKKVVGLSNTLIEKEIAAVQDSSNKANKTAKDVKEEIDTLKELLVKDVDIVLSRVKQKLVNNTEDSIVSDVMLTLRNSVTGVLGFNMHKSLEETYEGLNKHEEIVTKGYNISYAIKKAYRSYVEATNGDSLVYKEVQNFVERELGVTDNQFVIGEDTDDQQLNIMKSQPNQNMYGEDGSGSTIDNGGNRIDYTRADGTVETIRLARSETSNASTSLSPLGTHRRDTNVVHRVLEFLKVNQIYDAFVTSGRSRLLSEWLANLEFVRQTLFTPHEVTYTIRNLKELQKNLGTMKLVNNNDLNMLVEKIMEDYHIRKSIFGPNSKAKGRTIEDLSGALDRVIKSLENEETRLDNQRADLFDSLTTVGQYGVVGTVEFDKGKLLGFRVRLGETNKLVSMEDLGLPANMKFHSEEDMVSIAKKLVSYVKTADNLVTSNTPKDVVTTNTNIVDNLKV